MSREPRKRGEKKGGSEELNTAERQVQCRPEKGFTQPKVDEVVRDLGQSTFRGVLGQEPERGDVTGKYSTE